VLHLGQVEVLAGRENIVLLGPPGTGKTHLAIALGIRACLPASASGFAPPPNGSRCWPTPNATAATTPSSVASNGSHW
jgi:hypothetical protein